MLKIALLVITAFAVEALQPKPCAYWCEASCTKKSAQFYCCSYEPTLTGPKEFLRPYCKNLCESRPKNEESHQRNCKQEIDNLQAAGTYNVCRNFQDCNRSVHDLCCPDNCVPENRKMCVTL